MADLHLRNAGLRWSGALGVVGCNWRTLPGPCCFLAEITINLHRWRTRLERLELSRMNVTTKVLIGYMAIRLLACVES